MNNCLPLSCSSSLKSQNKLKICGFHKLIFLSNKIVATAERDIHRWKEIVFNNYLIFNFRDKNLLTFCCDVGCALTPPSREFVKGMKERHNLLMNSASLDRESFDRVS